MFSGTEILYSNLGGAGPLLPIGASTGLHGIRYVNVGTVYNLAGEATNIDLMVTNQTSYTAYNSSLNILNGKFAQINLACNREVLLRVEIVRSCSSGASCVLCEDASLDESAKASCYSAGCACFGAIATNSSSCSGASKEAARASYACAQKYVYIRA